MRKTKSKPNGHSLTVLQEQIALAYATVWENCKPNISLTARRLGVTYVTCRKHLIRFKLYRPKS